MPRTSAVMGSRRYGMAGAEVIAPKGAEAAAVDADYKALAQAGSATAEQRERLHAAGAGLMARGAAAVLLSGTELSLAFDGAAVHAGAIARATMHCIGFFRLRYHAFRKSEFDCEY